MKKNMMINTLSLALDKVHLAEASRELALLDLLREVAVAEPLGKLDATVAPRFAWPQQRRWPRSLGERVRDSIGLCYVKVNRPIVFMEMRLHEPAVRRIAVVHARCSVAISVRARVVDTVVVRRVS